MVTVKMNSFDLQTQGVLDLKSGVAVSVPALFLGVTLMALWQPVAALQLVGFAIALAPLYPIVRGITRVAVATGEEPEWASNNPLLSVHTKHRTDLYDAGIAYCKKGALGFALIVGAAVALTLAFRNTEAFAAWGDNVALAAWVCCSLPAYIFMRGVMSIVKSVSLRPTAQIVAALDDDFEGDVCPWCHHVLHDLAACSNCDWRRSR